MYLGFRVCYNILSIYDVPKSGNTKSLPLVLRKGSFYSPNRPQIPTKCTTNTPPAVGADSSYSYFRLTILTHFCFHARIFVLSNTHFHFTEYIYSHHWIRIYSSSYTHFRSTFRGCIQICGHDKSTPTAACRLSKYCERIIKMQHSRNKIRCEHFVNTQHLQCKNTDIVLQNYCICKTIVTI